MLVVVVLVLACLAVLGAVVALAMGRGGELSAAPRDHPPLPPPDDRPFTGPEPFELPRALWGYQVDVTDQTIHRLRQALYDRDARLASLERQIDDLRRRAEERSHEQRVDPAKSNNNGAASADDGADDPAGSAERDEARP